MNNPIRILFVDDDEDELLMLRDLLFKVENQGYTIDWATGYHRGAERITSFPDIYDICIVDYHLGTLTGLHLLSFIKQNNQHLPVIIFTGQGDVNVDMEAMKAGAADYLVKGKIDSNILERSIRYSIMQAKTHQKLIEHETQLRDAEKFAITGRIALVIAHEVRNPLTNVKLALHQLRDELKEADKSITELYDIAERNCDRINQLITNLLQSTKFSELKKSKASINKLLDEALKQVEDRIKMKGVIVVKKYAEDLSEVNVDAEKIKIAFLNIILNAVEAVNDEKGIISVSTEAKEKKCMITIKDNGKGISRDNLYRIFEPYFTEKENGMGLGLTSSQTIIYNHDGTIHVESKPGKGTTFFIALDFN